MSTLTDRPVRFDRRALNPIHGRHDTGGCGKWSRCTPHGAGDTKGMGQQGDFIATDILAVQGDRITDNWHLEDNLTFLQQIGLMPR
jgi:hypothetical protein